MVQKLLERVLAAGGSIRPLTRPEMEEIARGVDLARLDLASHRRFRDDCYARNQVLLNDHLELVVICWRPGQTSAIHDHGASRCLYLVVEGEMREERFVLGADDAPEPRDERRFERGAMTMAVGPEIHRIVNPGPRELVTVHLYSPPIGAEARNFTPIPRTIAAPQLD